MKKRPNILFLMSDEHRADVTGYEGNTVVRTPVLDRLAREGVVFRNAYTPSPICIPSRQCLASGQLPKTCGCEVFGDDLPPGSMTFARLFSQYGYMTAACGKLHHMGSDQMQGWRKRIGGDTEVHPRFIEDFRKEEDAQFKPPHKQKWDDAKEIKRAGIGKGPYTLQDEYSVLGAMQFIEEYFNSPYYDREQNNPVLLMVSLYQPHYPYLTSEDKFNYYLNRVQPFVDQDVSNHPFLRRRHVQPGLDASVRELRRATAAYYGMIETMDAHFGAVLESLERIGQDLDEWIIVYASDHGEMLGEHGVWEKQKFYEASVRVPLIIRWPSSLPRGTIVEQNVNLCDLFATLCDMSGLPVPAGRDSRSLVPLMNGVAEGWSNETISHFSRDYLMIKQDHLKYQYYGTEMPEVLFDLRRNPEETVNFIDDLDYATTISEFRSRRSALGYGPNANLNYTDAGYVPLNLKGG